MTANYFQHEARLVEDRTAFPGFVPALCKFGSSEDDLMDSDDTNGHPHAWPTAVHLQSADYKMALVPAGRMRQDLKQGPVRNGWLHKMVCYLLPMFLPCSMTPCEQSFRSCSVAVSLCSLKGILSCEKKKKNKKSSSIVGDF